jgi:ATP-dependent Zn protease
MKDYGFKEGDFPICEETAKEIDADVETFIKEAEKRAEVVIMKNRKGLDDLKDALLKKETIDETEVADILKNAVLPKEAALY